MELTSLPIEILHHMVFDLALPPPPDLLNLATTCRSLHSALLSPPLLSYALSTASFSYLANTLGSIPDAPRAFIRKLSTAWPGNATLAEFFVSLLVSFDAPTPVLLAILSSFRPSAPLPEHNTWYYVLSVVMDTLFHRMSPPDAAAAASTLLSRPWHRRPIQEQDQEQDVDQELSLPFLLSVLSLMGGSIPGDELPSLANRSWKGKNPLHIAVCLDHAQLVTTLLNHPDPGYASPSSLDHERTLLHLAAERGFAQTLTALVNHPSMASSINALHTFGLTPLTVAIQEKQPEAALVLLAHPDTDPLPSPEWASNLCIAAENGMDEVVTTLLACPGIDVNAEISIQEQWTPLMGAASGGHTSTLSILIQAGAEVGACNAEGRNALFEAASAGYAGSVATLLQAGAHPDAEIPDTKITPLLLAAGYGHTSAVRLLLEAGARPDPKTDINSSPLWEAAANGYTDIVELLLAAGVNPNVPGVQNATPLFAASQGGHIDVVNILVEAAADAPEILDAETETGSTPLLIAMARGRVGVAAVLMATGKVDPNIVRPIGVPIIHAVASSSVETLRVLLDHPGIDVNLCTSPDDTQLPPSFTALHLAADRGMLPMVEALLGAKGIDTEVRTMSGATPLYMACQNGFNGIVQALLQAGADPNACRDDGASPLLVAAEGNHADTVSLLVAVPSIDVTRATSDGTTPLLAACLNACSDSVSPLLSCAGVDANVARSSDGMTPLHAAAGNGYFEILTKLLNVPDLDLSPRMQDGRTPVDVAIEYSQDEAAHMITTILQTRPQE